MRSWRRRAPGRAGPLAPVPDERVWGRNYRGPRPWTIGVVIATILLLGFAYALTKELPFGDDGYELHATFDNAATLREDSPVRIAGVNVGEVTGIEPKGEAVEVSFTVDEEGQPIHSDAEVEIRPRLFLEGNFFLDLHPGSPSAPELDDEDAIPVTQTSTAVQLDEILTALQSDVRGDLRELLRGYGTTLNYQPTPADDVGQDPDVHGETAARSLNDTFRYGGPAGRDTAIVLDALRGVEPHDLSGLIAAQRDVFTQLTGHERQLQALITNFNVVAGALAEESENLRASLRELAPTLETARPSLAQLSAALPPLRRWALELRPSLRELPETIRASDPWLEQAALLLRRRELGRTLELLSDSQPGLARTADASLELFPELTRLGRCASQVLGPTADIVVQDADPRFGTGEPNWHEFFFGVTNLAGAMQSFDGNGSYVRLFTLTGPNDERVVDDNPDGAGSPGINDEVYARMPAEYPDPSGLVGAPDGTQPELPPSGPPPMRFDVPCATNAPPDVNGPLANPGEPSPEDDPDAP